MDVQQLKLLAGRVRDLLAQHNLQIPHGQALDAIAALPGLRSWPEVMAFPTRVNDCELTESTASRLSRRIQNRFGLEVGAFDLLRCLNAGMPMAESDLPELWPSGPEPGIYVTTSQAAIDTLMRHYDDATDGAPLYAEKAGGLFDSSIDLGEYGLWSQGLGRVPSGTLIVVGPIEMTQEEWSRNAERLQQACLHVLLSEHRIAVLFHTPAPAQLHSDALLLVKSDQPDMDDLHEAFKGVVTDHGELRGVSPFVGQVPKPLSVTVPEPEIPLPAAAAAQLLAVMAERPAGVVVLGSNEWKASRVILLEALIPLTTAAGPVARIRPDHRHDYDGEPPLSPRFEGIPVMPSIESAYAHGYRRMVIEHAFGMNEQLLAYAEEVCFLVGTFSAEVGDAFMNAFGRNVDKPEALEAIAAIIGLACFEGKKGRELILDMYVRGRGNLTSGADLDEMLDHLQTHRVFRWQDGLDELLSSKAVTVAQIKKALPNHHSMLEYLASKGKKSGAKAG